MTGLCVRCRARERKSYPWLDCICQYLCDRCEAAVDGMSPLELADDATSWFTSDSQSSLRRK